jgi:hypothetical protein
MLACRSLRAVPARLGLVASLSLAAGGALAQDHYDVVGTRIPAFVLLDGCPSEGACAGPNGLGNPLFVAPATGTNWGAPAIATSAAPSPTIGQPTSLSVDQYGSTRVLLMSPSGTAVDVTQPQPVIPYLSSSWTASQAACGATAAVALADSVGAAKQRSFVNVSGATIYIGPSSAVTTSTGFAIPSGAAPSNPAPGYTGPVYCIAGSSVSLGVSQLQ